MVAALRPKWVAAVSKDDSFLSTAMNTSIHEYDPRPKKALVVEDEMEIASLLTLLLARAGLDAAILSNGAEALACLQDEAKDYALVCSDIELPGASGWAVLEWVHTFQPALPIMLVSGVDDEDFLSEARRRGAVAAFRKPFSVNAIQRTLAEIFPRR
jgi:DNA-binding NtrC family response regulator